MCIVLCLMHNNNFLKSFLFQLVLNTEFPFKLSGKVLQVLVSIFLYHDFSVRNFIKGLQVSTA